MSKTVQLKRGNANVSASYVGAVGEITVNTTDYTLNIHDGVTPGGYVVTGINGGNIGNISLNDQTISGLNSNADIILDAGNANLDIQGNTVVTGNITADYYIGNGTLLTGLYSNADVVSLLNNFGNPISTTSNVTAAYFVGNGSNLTGVNVTTFANVRVNNQTIFSINEPTEALVVGRGDGLGNVLIQGNVRLFDATIQNATLGNVIANGSVVSLGNIIINKVTGGRFIGDTVTLRYSNVVTGFCFTSNDQQFLTNTGLLHREQSSANPNVSVLAISHDQPVAYFYSNITTEMVGNLVITTSNKPHGAFANAFVAVYSNVNSYSQLIKQNTNEGTEASTDFVATANNGTDITFYVDLGIAGNLHADSEFFGDTTTYNDAYLYVTGYDQAGPSTGNIGNLIIGSTNGVVKTFIGNTAEANVVTIVDSIGLSPGANVTYSLGSATKQWKDLWVSNNTIYIGSIPLTIGANGALIVDGNVISGGNVTANTGNITFDNVNIIGTGNINLQPNPANPSSYLDIFETVGPDLHLATTSGAMLVLGRDQETQVRIIPGGNVAITANNNSSEYTWNFDVNGNLTLPLSGAIIGATANNSGYINWFGNSSGDGGGYTTMNIVPDDTRVGGDQYLIIDPTAPGHIHIRAGGTQDNSGAELYLGGENSYFKVDAGPNPDVVVAADGEQWRFSQGQLILANGLSTIQSLASSSLDPLNPNVSTMTFTPDPSYGLQALVLDPTAPGHIHLRAPSFVGNIDDPSANLFLGGETSSFEVGYGANASVFVHSNGNTWTFDNSGNLTTPGAIILTGNITTGASPAPSISGFSSISVTGNITGNFFIGNGSQLTGLSTNASTVDITNTNGLTTIYYPTFVEDRTAEQILRADVDLSYRTDTNTLTVVNLESNGNITVNDTIFVVGSIQPTGASPAPYLSGFSSISTVISGNSNEGNITAHNHLIANGGIITTGNVTANYFIGNGSLLTGITASANYSNANVVSMLGANTYVELGNVVTTYPTASNITTVFFGNSTAITNGSTANNGTTNLYNNLYHDVNGALRYRNTQTGAVQITMGGSGGFTLGGTTGSVTANAASGLGLWATLTSSALQTYNSININASGNLLTTAGVVNTGAVVGFLYNTTASTVNMGGAATTIAMGASTGTVTIGSGNGNLTVGNITAGNISSGNLSVTGNITGNINGFTIGYRDIPQVTFTSNATLALTDAGKHYYSSNSANVITIPNNSTVSFNVGTAVSIVQQGTANLTISPASGVTLYLAGNTSAGSRTLGSYGMATLMKVATDTWFINGTGLT